MHQILLIRSLCSHHPSDRSLVLLIVAALLTGCAGGGTFANVKPEVSPARLAERPTTLQVGEIVVTDQTVSADEGKNLADNVRFGISEWIREHGAVLTVSSTTNTVAEPKAILVTGMVNRVEKGSAALRFWVGMGAGQEKVSGEFEVRDDKGDVIYRFYARRSYLGGLEMTKTMAEMGLRLGHSVGETVVDWVTGKNLERTSK